MDWLDIFKWIMKLIPCILSLLKNLNAAKDDDGKVDFEEAVEIAEQFLDCITEKTQAFVQEMNEDDD